MAKKSCVLVVLLTLVAGTAVFAHHGASAYDRSKQVNFKATVTNFRWANPHVFIFFERRNDKGEAEQWTCESINPGMMTKQGWTRNTLKPGDQVTIIGFPSRTGSTVMLLEKLILPDGKELVARLLD